MRAAVLYLPRGERVAIAYVIWDDAIRPGIYLERLRRL
jgi:hypothetical protein